MRTKRLYSLLVLFVFFCSALVNAQPPNDFQCTPHDMGALPMAPICSPSGPGFTIGGPISASGTTLGATNDSLSGSIHSCTTAMLKDVWYKFSGSETHVIITIKGVGANPLQNAYVGLYETLTDECVGLMPRQCHVSSGVALDTFDFGPLAFGVKYYLQVSSTTASGAGNFLLTVRGKNVCADCMHNSVLQSYPLPVRGAFPPDTTVGFCYSVVGYNEQFGNRFHGVVPLLGSGWDATTLNVISLPASADGVGTWNWHSGLNVHGDIVSGVFYDVGDANPLNNLGDQGGLTHLWTTCFTVKTQTQALCAAGQNDLSILFRNYSDGESGSLITPQNCAGDAEYVLDAHMDCCQKPYVLPSAAACDSVYNGAINAYGGSFSFFGYTYDLYDHNGALIDNFFSASTNYSNDSLIPGNYYLYVTDHQNNCQSAINVLINGPLVYTIDQTAFGCGSSCTNAAQLNIISGAVQSVLWDNGSTTMTATGLCPGFHSVTITDTGTFACTKVANFFITSLGFGNSNFDYNQGFYCTSDTFATIGSFPTATGGTFSLAAGSVTNPVDPSTGTVTLVNPGTVYIKYDSPPPCNSVTFDTIIVGMSPPPVSMPVYSDHFICVGNPNPNFINGTTTFNINWYDTANTNIGMQTPGSGFDPFFGSPATPGIYNFTVTQQNPSASSCESGPIGITISVFNNPPVDAGADQSTCPGFGVQLQATGADSYVWSPSALLDNATVSNPTASLDQTAMFFVVGTNTTNGCSTIDSVRISIDSLAGCGLVIYSGFTPNGDTHNDFWFIDGISKDRKNTVSIFNRWGEKIWEQSGYNNDEVKWHGQNGRGELLPDGTYYYLINFESKQYKGWVELTR